MELSFVLFSRVKKNQDAYVESFNDKFRDECLNMHWFFDSDNAERLES